LSVGSANSSQTSGSQPTTHNRQTKTVTTKKRNMSNWTSETIADWFKGLQDRICSSLETLDGKGKFQEDLWVRPEGGGGRTRIIEGDLIEKGGVNFSEVHGVLSEQAAKALHTQPGSFFATGVSIVLHPKNPMMPIIHMNVRYFEMNDSIWWFGGGIDLTPHYIVPEDAKFFHQYLKNTCDKHHAEYHPKFKKWADDYFFIRHRNETRGVGGIFFDRLSNKDGFSKEERFGFTQDVGESFVPIYEHLANQNRDLPYSDQEKDWQFHRRGRYVEFNLVWDRGTKFGLETNGRTESILMSLPAQASWTYNHQVEPNSREAFTLANLNKEADWLK
jgi:coproporphyrinogen III oxidase